MLLDLHTDFSGAGKVVWYSHIFQNFPVYFDPKSQRLWHSQKVKVDVILEFSCFSLIQRTLVIWSLVPLPFLNPAWTSESSWFTYCWSLTWRILSITLLACEMSEIVWEFEQPSALPLFGMEWNLTWTTLANAKYIET